MTAMARDDPDPEPEPVPATEDALVDGVRATLVFVNDPSYGS